MVINILYQALKTKWAWMAVAIAIPSLGQVYKYLGIPGFIAFASITGACIFLIDKKWVTLSILLSKKNVSLVLTALIVAFLLVIFTLIYPDANAGMYGGGSDADDALKIGAKAVLNLDNPYHHQTYLGLPITPGLGALFLSIPFYLMGNVSYQNFFWLFLLIFFIHKYYRDANAVFLFLVIVYILNPLSLVQIATGVDHLTNGIYVFLFLLFFVSLFEKQKKNSLLFLSAVLLGIGITSRMNFVFIFPVLFAHIYYINGWKSALKWTSVPICTLLILSLPLYFHAPASFTPIKNAANRIGQGTDFVQVPTLLIGFIAVCTAGILCLKRFNLTKTSVFLNVALIQVISISATVIIRAILNWRVEPTDLITFDYAAFVIPFFAFVFVSKLQSDRKHT